MKKILLGLVVAVLILTHFKEKEQETVIIPSDSIRLRVISNSNSELDIKEKIELKDHLEDILFELTQNANSKNEVSEIIIDNLDYLNEDVYKFLNSNNYKIDYGQNYFPSKVYRGVVYKEGMYDSLVVTLGNGKGQNWWCVLFPPLCLLEENTNTTDVEYQLFVSRIIDGIR